jgi:hypothetical protein
VADPALELVLGSPPGEAGELEDEAPGALEACVTSMVLAMLAPSCSVCRIVTCWPTCRSSIGMARPFCMTVAEGAMDSVTTCPSGEVTWTRRADAFSEVMDPDTVCRASGAADSDGAWPADRTSAAMPTHTNSATVQNIHPRAFIACSSS